MIPLPRAQTNFSCFQTLFLPQPAVAIEDIHPSTQDDYDWSSHQTINLFPPLFLLSPSLLFSFSLCLLHFILLLFCWWAEYDEKVRVQIALTPWHVRVTMQSLFDLEEQLIHMFIYLFFWHVTFFSSFQWKPTNHSCKHKIIILCLQVLFCGASWSLTTKLTHHCG